MAKQNKIRTTADRGLMNKHQRKAFRAGEVRVGREQIEELLEISRSERRFAMVCEPCDKVF